MINHALNGCNNIVKFQDKIVYYNWTSGIEKSSLGNQLDKDQFLKSIVDENNINKIKFFMIDWELYENGWLVKGTDNKKLFYYLCQIGNYGLHRPEELNYFK